MRTIAQVPKVGDVVIYADARGNDHNALIQCVWSETCINVIIVSQDEAKKDSFGRQIEHETSVGYRNPAWVHGKYWRWPGDEKLGYRPPQES